jgi:hypothetical protein
VAQRAVREQAEKARKRGQGPIAGLTAEQLSESLEHATVRHAVERAQEERAARQRLSAGEVHLEAHPEAVAFHRAEEARQAAGGVRVRPSEPPAWHGMTAPPMGDRQAEGRRQGPTFGNPLSNGNGAGAGKPR